MSSAYSAKGPGFKTQRRQEFVYINCIVSIIHRVLYFTCYNMLRHVTHNNIINFVRGLLPLASGAHCRYTFLHKYLIMIFVCSILSIKESKDGANL